MAVGEFFPALNPDPTSQGIHIEELKYDAMRNTILKVLQANGPIPFSRLAASIEEHLQNNFDDSVMLYFTTVKLDLEARGEIHRVPNSKPQLIEIVK